MRTPRCQPFQVALLFATVSYGDFFPVTDFARGIVTVEIILAMLYTAMVFTLVVAWIIQAVQKKPG
jgi:hypothetical protein